MVTDAHETARAMVSKYITAADGDTRVALIQLAARFDAHMADCPHVEAPIARPHSISEYREGVPA